MATFPKTFTKTPSKHFLIMSFCKYFMKCQSTAPINLDIFLYKTILPEINLDFVFFYAWTKDGG
jgi:hypothetical protein